MNTRLVRSTMLRAKLQKSDVLKASINVELGVMRSSAPTSAPSFFCRSWKVRAIPLRHFAALRVERSHYPAGSAQGAGAPPQNSPQFIPILTLLDSERASLSSCAWAPKAGFQLTCSPPVQPSLDCRQHTHTSLPLFLNNSISHNLR